MKSVSTIEPPIIKNVIGLLNPVISIFVRKVRYLFSLQLYNCNGTATGVIEYSAEHDALRVPVAFSKSRSQRKPGTASPVSAGSTVSFGLILSPAPQRRIARSSHASTRYRSY